MVNDTKTTKKRSSSIIIWLLTVYCALIPLEQLMQASIGGSVHRYLGILIMGLIAVMAIGRNRKLSFMNMLSIFFFAVLAFASTLWTNVGMSTSVLSIMLNAMLFTAVAVQYPLSKQAYSKLMVAMIAVSVMIAALLVLGQGTGLISVNAFDGWRITITVNGLVLDNNNLALSLCIPALCALSFVFDKNLSKKKRRWSAAAFLAILFAILLTGSRGGLLALLAGIAVYYYQYNNGIKLSMVLKVLLVSFVIGILAVLLLPESLLGRFSIEDVVSSGGTGRVEIWTRALKIYFASGIDRMIIGYGFGSFPKMMLANYGIYKAAHNDLVQVLLELGIVGVFAYCAMWFQFFKVARKKKHPLMLALLVTVFLGSMSMELLIKKMLWIAIFLIYAYCDDTKESDGASAVSLNA